MWRCRNADDVGGRGVVGCDDVDVEAGVSCTLDVQLQVSGADCPEPLEISEEELHYQLGEFSRNFNMDNWDNAMEVKKGLGKAGKTPKFAVTTKELYDKSFSFPKVRNYDYAVEQMNELEHYEDNLNNNLSNKLALTRFVEVAKKVRANLNDKYDIGFIDPGVEGDW